MYTHITQSGTQTITITTPGDHIFYISNISTSLTFHITVPHAHIYVYGLYHAKETQDHTLTITHHHAAAHTQSTTLIKSVLDHSSNFHFTGMIHIDHDAPHVIANMTNHNLLCDTTSRAWSAPQLEVTPHSVTCAHRSITAPLDASAINYLTTRGINPHAAQKILTDAFMREVSEAVKQFV